MIRRKAWLVGALRIETTTQRCIAQGEAAAPLICLAKQGQRDGVDDGAFLLRPKGGQFALLAVTQRAFRAHSSQGEVGGPDPQGGVCPQAHKYACNKINIGYYW